MRAVQRAPRRTGSRVVGRFGIFDVVEHEVERADGAPHRPIRTVACADWVCVAPVTPAGDVVLVRQWRFGIDAFTLEPPGGVVDAGEEPAHAAARELREETGYEAASIEPLGFVHPNPPTHGNRCWMFLARGAVRVGPPQPDVDEDCAVVLVPLAELRARLGEGELTHALAILTLTRALDRLGAAR